MKSASTTDRQRQQRPWATLVVCAAVLAAGCSTGGSGGGNNGSADETPPSVTLQAPASGAVLSGQVQIRAEANDDVGVARVELSVDGTALQTLTGAPYEATWDTAAAGDGQHAVRATAWDAAGNTAEAAVSVTVDNTAPEVAFTTPAGGATVSGSVSVQVSATDDGGIASVDLYAGGSLFGSLQSGPYAWTVDTTAFAGGALELRAVATDAAGNTAEAAVSVTVDNGAPDLPPDPADVAPDLDPTVATSFLASTAFLYTGDDPIQTGVAPGTIEKRRAAAVRGRVIGRDGEPVPGVMVSVHGHPELGQTLSRADGRYVLAVNGGGSLVVAFQKDGLLPAHRRVDVGWNAFAVLPDLVLIPLDDAVTEVDLSTPGMKVVRGSPETDASGTRTATLLVPDGVAAEMVLPDGTTRPLDALHVRATEYTVGDSGPAAMPAELPPTSGYTYALEYTADEALAAGATRVSFSEPVIHYVEDIIGFPVGSAVPAGYYDPDLARWVPSDNGRVVQVLGQADGLAELDTDGDGAADDAATLAALGVTDAERAELAALYGPDQVLWRVPLPHFTPWDCNWPYGPPDDAVAPNQPLSGFRHPPSDQEDDPCTDTGSSIIECQNQVLRETVPVVGTPVTLNYRSDRVRGELAAFTADIPVTGPTVPASLKRVQLAVQIAGKGSAVWTWRATDGDLSRITQRFQWDQLDWLGRPPQGTTWGLVTISYFYDAVYYAVPAEFEQAFLQIPESRWTAVYADEARGEIRTVQKYTVALYPYAQKDLLKLGGWSLSPVHNYDLKGRVLELGDGTRRTVDWENGSVLEPYAGTGEAGYDGDGGPATGATFRAPHAVATTADGSVLIADTVNNVIRRVDPDGTVSTVFAQAPLFGLESPQGVAVGEDGSIYIAEAWGHRIRRKAPDGVVSVFAGTGSGPGGGCTTGGDGGPAAEANICLPSGLAFGPDGSLYVAETGANRIRRIGPDGTISTVAGGAVVEGGEFATDAVLHNPRDVAVGPDGCLFVADTDNYRILKVYTDGRFAVVAGTGNRGHSGDGGRAIDAQIEAPFGVAVDQEGRFYIATVGVRGGYIRQVAPNGIITTLAGGGDREDALRPRRVHLDAPFDVAVAPDKSVVIPERDDDKLVRVTFSIPGVATGEFLVPSANGREYYRFDEDGRHLATLHGLTHEVLYTFSYDDAGYLVAITDGDGNVTTIERAADGTALAIVGPDGDRTELEMDADGYLAEVTDPSGATTRFTYGQQGLLIGYTDALGFEFTYTYDERNRLVRAEDPAGGSKALELTLQDNGRRVTKTTASGYQTVQQIERLPDGAKHLQKTYVDGTVKRTEKEPDGTTTVRYGDGTETVTVLGRDPRWGLDTPQVESLAVTTPGGLEMAVGRTLSATLAEPGDPLSVVTLTTTLDVNGRVATTAYDAAERRLTHTSPVGRTTTSTIDEAGRVVASQAPGLASRTAAYDARGRITAFTVGAGDDARTHTLAYGLDGRLALVTDPLGSTLGLVWDDAGRITGITYPGGAQAALAHDAVGQVTAVTPPGKPAHDFGYDAVGMPTRYDPPGGAGGAAFTYNPDRQVTAITQPGGEVIGFSYDAGTGQLTRVTTPDHGAITLAYAANGQVASIATDAAGGGVTLGFDRDGSLLTAQGITGPFDATVNLAYDNDFALSTETLVVGLASWPASYAYDDDKLLTSAGALAYTRDPASGLVTATTLGVVATAREYNAFGELSQVTVTASGQEKYFASYVRDKLGRIVEKTERIDGGAAVAYGYAYDDRGRLLEVTEGDGATVTYRYAYTYDANGNRTSLTDRGGAVTQATTINDQDQVAGYGGTAYTYDPAGNRATRVAGGETTTYAFGARNYLRAVTLADGTEIGYVLDGLGRRVAKKRDGVLEQGYVYRGAYRIVAELDGAGAVASRFVYGEGAPVPEYLEKGGRTYRIVADHLGSVRLVLDAADGSVVQRLDYDAFGVVERDTNPGFQPFGFAGGLYDPDTGLVHFGAREYDPEAGRWLSKDPILFLGGDFNLYAYVKNDPVNAVDPLGLCLSPCGEWDYGDMFDFFEDLIDFMTEDLPEALDDRYYKDLPDPRDALDLLDGFADVVDLAAKADEKLGLGAMPKIPKFPDYVSGAIRGATGGARRILKSFDKEKQQIKDILDEVPKGVGPRNPNRRPCP